MTSEGGTTGNPHHAAFWPPSSQYLPPLKGWGSLDCKVVRDFVVSSKQHAASLGAATNQTVLEVHVLRAARRKIVATLLHWSR